MLYTLSDNVRLVVNSPFSRNRKLSPIVQSSDIVNLLLLAILLSRVILFKVNSPLFIIIKLDSSIPLLANIMALLVSVELLVTLLNVKFAFA